MCTVGPCILTGQQQMYVFPSIILLSVSLLFLTFILTLSVNPDSDVFFSSFNIDPLSSVLLCVFLDWYGYGYCYGYGYGYGMDMVWI